MRKTKYLVQLLLLCMILTNLSSGTLAVYTKSIEFENPVSVTAKRFYIGVNSAGDFDIFLAPGESSYNEFTVTNVDTVGMPTEVDMSLSIEGDFSELYRELPGITVTLNEVGNTTLQQKAADDGTFKYFEEIGFRAEEAGTRTFRLVFSWDGSTQDQTIFAGKHISGITLYITGTQAI